MVYGECTLSESESDVAIRLALGKPIYGLHTNIVREKW